MSTHPNAPHRRTRPHRPTIPKRSIPRATHELLSSRHLPKITIRFRPGPTHNPVIVTLKVAALKKSALFTVLLIAFVDLIPFGLIIPLQADYAKSLNASPLMFGLILGCYSLAQFIFAPILGRISDRVGRRPVLLISIAGSVIAHLMLAFADIAASLPLLFAARVLDGVTGGNIAVAQACIADVTTPENRSKGMGLFGAAFGLGFVVGPALGALLAIGGTAWPGFGAAAISLVALALVLFALPETRPAGSRSAADRAFSLNKLRQVLQNPRITELIAIYVTTAFAFVFLEATFVYLCKDVYHLDKAGVGFLFSYIGILLVLVQGGLIGRLVPRFGEPALIVIGLVITAAGMFAISITPLTASPILALLILACVPIALGNGITSPSLQGLISQQAIAGQQGGTLGIAQGLASLSRAVAPPLAGACYGLQPSLPYWSGGTLLLITAIFAITVKRKQSASTSAE
jgi:MFS family permease